MRFRAQIESNDGSTWVDGGLYSRRANAEANAAELAARFGNEVRVIEDSSTYPWDEA